MYSYKIRGDDYDTIVIDTRMHIDAQLSTQYYMKNGMLVGQDEVVFGLRVVDGKVSLECIETEAVDTVIVPKGYITQILPYAMKGVGFKRLVLPKAIDLHLCDHALCGSDTLEEFQSLSRNVSFGVNVFPQTVVRRYF